MAALGVDLEAAPDRMNAALDELGFVFFFAPAYHPAFRTITPVRKALAARGRRSIFNVLGPLLNPGRPAHVLLGVYAEPWVPRLALAFELLGLEAGLAVHGELGPERGIDELTTATSNRVRGIGRLRHIDARWEAGDFGLPSGPFTDLMGSDVAGNMALVGRSSPAGDRPPS